ncbi:MAG: restriction endonuclease subunit S, partial [bacterium]
PIQQQIVSELDTLSDIISKKKQQLADLDILAQATFYEMFGDPVSNEKGWKFKKLADICVNIVDCPHSTPKKVDIPTPYPCIRTSELKKGQIVWKSMQYTDKDEYENRIKRLIPQKGDIVYGREGTYGDAVCLPNSHNFSLGQRTMLFRPNIIIVNSIYLLHIVISDYVYQQAKNNNSGSTVGHVNVSDIKKFSIPIPPLTLQNQFSERIESIEEQKSLINKSLADVQHLFDYTMDRYFN